MPRCETLFQKAGISAERTKQDEECWKKDKSSFSNDKKTDNKQDNNDKGKKEGATGNPWGQFQNKDKFAEMHWC